MIEFINISKTYRSGRAAVYALREVSVTIQPGEFVAIMGPSGSGKSTLLHVMGFLDRPDSGTYRFLKTDITQLNDDQRAAVRNRVLGFVFQQFHLLRRANALENTGLPLIYAGKKKTHQTAYQRLVDVGLSERTTNAPSELSGGEQQRVAIARSLVNEPLIIFADEPTGNLDTKSEEEIMGILTRLNKEGKTIVMVTHEQEIARYATRIIQMRDGKIVSDKSKTDHRPAAQATSVSLDRVIREKHSSLGGIESFEHIRQAFHAVASHKMRSFLSILGILIGVAAVIAMLALGAGAKEAMEDRIKTLGSNLLSIQGGSRRVRGAATAAGTIARFTPADVEAIRELGPLIKKASGYANGSAQVVYGNENWNTRVEGVDFEYGEMRASIPEVGRWFTRDEITRRDKVAIAGLTVAEKLFGGKNPLGETMKINRIYFKVIGIAPEKGGGGWRDQDDVVYIPVTTAMYRILGKDYLDGMYAEVADVALIEEAQEKIEQLIMKRHRIYKNDEDAFHMHNMSEIQEMLTETTRTMSILLGCIAAISLLVGGIGIMNIMLVSVTERTREIGLRKAIGARKQDIMTQFLIEAIVMTFSGGILGIALGAGAAVALSVSAGWATKVSLPSILLATIFSVAVGIGFGLWPARKAAQLDPVEALRYE